MSKPVDFESEVASRLGNYVYLLVDPRDGMPFYVGVGTRKRAVAHLRLGVSEELNGPTAKVARIREIRQSGAEPRIVIVRHGLETSDPTKVAYTVEASLIDVLRTVVGLTNIVGGHDTVFGLADIDDLHRLYGAPPLDPALTTPAILFVQRAWVDQPEEMEPGCWREGYGWHRDLTVDRMRDSVRGWWKLSPRTVGSREINHAVVVAEGVTRAVFHIDAWLEPRRGRHAFAATPINDGRVFEEYVGSLGKKVQVPKRNAFIYWPPKTADAGFAR